MADDIYVVEKIISRRVTESGQVEYFLKWFGYDEADATWEPEENVFCKDLIEQYEYRRKINDECKQILERICDEVQSSLEIATPASPTATGDSEEQEINDNFLKTFDRNLITDLLSDHSLQNEQENGGSGLDSKYQCSKRSNTTPLTRKKKLRPASVENITDEIPPQPTNMDTEPIDYLSLGPERIISITRSRTATHELEFLLKCTRCPSKLYFIPNDKAKELIPDLLIDFYERHINWFIDRPSSRQKLQKQKF
ncbi:unnamed protein product [Adineta ricciae]|uniref:Chromo domain-containing protein n=1 Tax=Adineta ricciae TaxID=249248 RepID=A0A813P8T3_ADIRI|nr:unnamed protein product [Adineta ricciae]